MRCLLRRSSGPIRLRFPLVGSGSARVVSPPLAPLLINGRPYLVLDMGRRGTCPVVPRPGVTGLWGKSVVLDPRLLTSYVRDVSLVSAEAGDLQAPRQLVRHPGGFGETGTRVLGHPRGRLGRARVFRPTRRGAARTPHYPCRCPAAARRPAIAGSRERARARPPQRRAGCAQAQPPAACVSGPAQDRAPMGGSDQAGRAGSAERGCSAHVPQRRVSRAEVMSPVRDNRGRDVLPMRRSSLAPRSTEGSVHCPFCPSSWCSAVAAGRQAR